MLEPLVALSLASSILQVIDFTGSIVGSSYELYRDVGGATRADCEAESAYIDLQHICDSLAKQSNDLTANGPARQDDPQLREMAMRCNSLALEVLKRLQELRVQPDSKCRSWDALRKAYNRSMPVEITSLTTRTHLSLERRAIAPSDAPDKSSMRQVLDDLVGRGCHLGVVAAEALATSRLELHDAVKQHENDALKLVCLHADDPSDFPIMLDGTALTRTREDLLQRANRCHEAFVAVSQSIPRTETLSKDARGHSRPRQSIDALREEARSRFDDSSQLLVEMLLRVVDEGARVATMNEVLESLRYREMPFRHIQIPRTYADTFSWIFDDEQTPFRRWLQSGNGIFWISGKAGSGKSTMMKFISDDERTRDILSTWAGDASNLIIASYYFWSSGSSMQKSQEGLLQSLLYEILRQCPAAIPEATPKRWNAEDSSHVRSLPWTRAELSRTIRCAIAHKSSPLRYCFFIDGLDEYAGDHYAMIEDLRLLTESPDVKLCVSSRPWNVFRQEYDRGERVLVLQEHTKLDMDRYIKGILEDDARFRNQMGIHSHAQAFACEIRERANGVFLWVFLVARSLLWGLDEQDDISMLWKRLREVPPTLETYFEKMLRNVEKVYRVYTSRSLLLACAAKGPLPALVFWYLTVEIDDPGFAEDMETRPLADCELDLRLRSVKACVNKWCRDLLEVNHVPYMGAVDKSMVCQVNFLHRTVRDFLMDSGDMNELFKAYAGPDFNPRLSLCRLYLAQTKILTSQYGSKQEMIPFFSLAGHIMFHAKECETYDGGTPYTALEELDKVGASLRGCSYLCHWADVHPGAQAKVTERAGSTFLSYAVEYDLQIFVSEYVAQKPESIKKPGRPLLEHAMEPRLVHELLPAGQGPLAQMIELLIGEGAPQSDDFKYLWAQVLVDRKRDAPRSLKVGIHFGLTRR